MTGSLLFVCTDAGFASVNCRRERRAEDRYPPSMMQMLQRDHASGGACGDGGCERAGIAHIFVLVQNLVKIK